MNYKSIFLLIAVACLTACASNHSPMDLADPMVGTGFHGHTYPGATTPFGAVQLSPDTRSGNWDACSGYHYDDNTIEGFSHNHLSGTGCCDLGDVTFRPTAQYIDLTADSLYKGTRFSHSNETARPGYYSVKLIDEDILVELSATTHTGMHKYTFPKGKPARIIVDLDHMLTRENLKQASIEKISDSEIQGMRVTNGWVPDQHAYFTARFSQPIADCQIVKDGHAAVLTFENTGKPIEAAVGLSAVSAENSRLNLNREVPELNFEKIADETHSKWEEALGVIKVEGATPEQLRNFYSALYHCMVTPNQMSDVNGQFRRNNSEIANVNDGSHHYSTLSLWDTYRAWHPLMTILNPNLVCDIINSMLDMYDATGELPIWPLSSGETGCMIGYHSVSVIADAYLKGLRCFDAEKALAAMIASSSVPRKGADIYAENGYIPSDEKRESVACALEYCYDDWCIARMAETMGNQYIADVYYQRARNYENVFDGGTRFFRGKRSDGNWETPFVPSAVSKDMTEATLWQYRFAPVHDIKGLANAFGGYEPLTQALDSIFIAPGLVGELSDITGLIGQYSHGNEPSHHIAYLFNYVGQPWKTQEWTRHILDEMYQPTPDGISGNEDCGQMSAWYVFTALGLYPVAPGSNEFALTSPIFEKATINLGNGNSLTVTANNPRKNKYIESVTLNGKVIDANYITYAALLNGGELKFKLTDKPNKDRGIKPEAFPYSMTASNPTAMPFIKENLMLFADSTTVTMGCNTKGAKIYYTLDGSTPDKDSYEYTTPFSIDKSCVVKAVAYRDGAQPSKVLKIEAKKAKYLQALNVMPKDKGVNYKYYEGNFSKTADIEKGKYIRSGIAETIADPETDREDYYGFVFTGYINVPEDGLYTFNTYSDDGSILLIDGVEVVNNDGLHSEAAAGGSVPMYAGFHEFKLLYFNNAKGDLLDWDWKLPSATVFTVISPSVLFH